MRTIFENSMRIHSVCRSHCGKIREKNEDNIYYNNQFLPREHIEPIKPEEWIFTTEQLQALGIFDGMGGENAGDLASYIAAMEFAGRMPSAAMDRESIVRILSEISLQVYLHGKKEKYRLIGSTATLLFCYKDKGLVVDVGDSPLFLCRGGKLTKLSQEHTDADILARNHIDRKPSLTQFLGIDTREMIMNPYVKEIDLLSGDIFLLCSDGLTDMVDVDVISEILNRETLPGDKADELLEKALDNGGADNTTLIICEIL